MPTHMQNTRRLSSVTWPSSSLSAQPATGRNTCLCVWKGVDISMVVMCNASDTIEYNRESPEPSIAALHTKEDTTSIEK